MWGVLLSEMTRACPSDLSHVPREVGGVAICLEWEQGEGSVQSWEGGGGEGSKYSLLRIGRELNVSPWQHRRASDTGAPVCAKVRRDLWHNGL